MFSIEHRIYSDLEKVLLDDCLVEQSRKLLKSPHASASAVVVVAAEKPPPEKLWQSFPLAIWENKDEFNVWSSESLAEATYDCFMAVKDLHHDFLALALPNDPYAFKARPKELKLDDIVELMDMVMEQYKAWEAHSKGKNTIGATFAPLKTWWYQSTEVISAMFENLFLGSMDEVHTDTFQDFVSVCHNMRFLIKLTSSAGKL